MRKTARQKSSDNTPVLNEAAISIENRLYTDYQAKVLEDEMEHRFIAILP